jgi:hypothetical protein
MTVTVQKEKQYMQTAARKLVIFDYSGTLSIEAPDFGKPDNLIRALEESGLAAVGVTNTEIFWEKIIFPTWDKGSRTTIGYAGVMADRIASLHLSAGIPPQGADSSILTAANSFVTMYLNHSRLDPLWRPLLGKLSADGKIAVVIATDHYAEATDAIVRYLGDWGIAATSAENIAGGKFIAKGERMSDAIQQAVSHEDSAFSLPLRNDGTGLILAKDVPPLPVIVANSADLGFWKAEQRFWELLKSRLPGRFETVLVVDDFGFNEADANGYGKLSLVRARRLKTEAVLREVFGANASTISFFIKKNDENHAIDSSRKIINTARRIEAAVQLYKEQVPLITVANQGSIC